jgi:hypothetical protein
MRYPPISKFLLLPLLLFSANHAAASVDSAAASVDSATITVVASGETHGMLKPCDCPNNPGGGLAERAAALNSLRDSAALLLLDAGGFAGGGIYDDYTGGCAADSAKTVVTIRAMAAMRYDAAVVGDDDLQYGGRWLARVAQALGLPLVSANCTINGTRLFPAYRVIVKNGVRFAVTGLTTQERLFPGDDSCVILPPIASLRKIWREMAKVADRRIILSHLGEEATLAVADSFPDADIIVNGHRKTSRDAAARHGRTLIMQFGYEGKKLSCATVQWLKAGRPGTLLKSNWLDIGPESGVDKTVRALMADSGSAPKRDVYDLYIMGECPYGCAALREFVDFVKNFPEIQWNLWFIGIAGNDSLSSLHGTDEALDEMTWLAVQALYPDRWLAFLSGRSMPQATSGAVIASLGLDAAAIGRWAKEKGRAALADHYRRSTRLGVSASPTLYIDNVLFAKTILAARLAKDQCANLGEKSSRCDSLPGCFEDADCREKGAVGRCSPQGRCEFRQDVPFTFTALVADSALGHPESSVIATTEELFPNATIRTLGLHSAEGGRMMKTYAPSSLPFYLFSHGADAAINFSRIESGLEKNGDGFSFRDGITPKNYFINRVEMPGSIVFFIDPLFPDAVAAMKRALDESLLSGHVRFLPVFYDDPAVAASAIDEKVRREESLRWLVMDSLHRGHVARYLRRYAENPGSSYWFLNLAGTGIAADSLYKEGRRHAEMLTAQFDLLNRLGIKDPMAVLIDNRRFTTIKNDAEFAAVLNELSRETVHRP